MASITGIDHVQVAMPVGGEAQARAFYSGVLGLAEVPKPAHLAVRGGAWFQCGAAQLHVGADSAFQSARKAHPALIVDGFAEFVGALADVGVQVELEEMVAGLRRATVNDPFGNKVELIEQR
ncbi:VOC family protein [Massilia pseudoviolaceinigra]|uniref:VOC family protein n=1 Tax=Massilia pseudoviolaceinigra TaxID=3057165 RepID=UPI00279684B7|nr:VOC family protein [Massilia sp. CCM 9206]MDQ1920833.1 glyoxalase [Massilia sp. CCM 9206]